MAATRCRRRSENLRRSSPASGRRVSRRRRPDCSAAWRCGAPEGEAVSMSLSVPVEVPSQNQPTADTRNPVYQALKGRIHTELLTRLNLDRLANVRREQAEPE